MYASGKSASEAYAQTVRLQYCLVGPALIFFPAVPFSIRAQISQISPRALFPNFVSIRTAPRRRPSIRAAPCRRPLLYHITHGDADER
jgi:hypothetical protein